MDISRPVIITPDGHEVPAICQRVNSGKISERIVVITHGLFSDMFGSFDKLAERFLKSGVDVIRFDFRGHGESPFPSEKFDISGAVTDYVTILKWVKGQDYKDISVVGASFGGSIVLLERLQPTPVKLGSAVFINPVVDYMGNFSGEPTEWVRFLFSPEKIGQIWDNGKAVLINEFYGSVDLLNQLSFANPYHGASVLNCSTLVMHGDKDEKLPYELVIKRLQEYENIEIDLVRGGCHGFRDPEHEAYVHQRAVDWIAGKRESL